MDINGPEKTADMETELELCPEGCAKAFNSLSWKDKKFLQVYSAALSVSNFMREDTEKHPWRYPFYAAYMAVWLSPYPPMISTVMTLATMAFAATKISQYATRLNSDIKGAFNKSAIMQEFKDHFRVHCPDTQQLKVKMWSLTKYAAVEMGKDAKHASIHAWDATERLARNIADRLPRL